MLWFYLCMSGALKFSDSFIFNLGILLLFINIFNFCLFICLLTGQYCQDETPEQYWPLPQGWEEVLLVYASCFKCLCCSIVRAKGTFNICYKFKFRALTVWFIFLILILSCSLFRSYWLYVALNHCQLIYLVWSNLYSR